MQEVQTEWHGDWQQEVLGFREVPEADPWMQRTAPPHEAVAPGPNVAEQARLNDPARYPSDLPED